MRVPWPQFGSQATGHRMAKKRKRKNTKDVTGETGDKHLPETWSWVDGGSCQILPQSSERRKRKERDSVCMIRKTGRRIERVSNLPPAVVLCDCVGRRVYVGWHDSSDNQHARWAARKNKKKKEQKKATGERDVFLETTRPRKRDDNGITHKPWSEVETSFLLLLFSCSPSFWPRRLGAHVHHRPAFFDP